MTSHKQTTDGNEYTTGYTYNLSGALIEQTYPSGRVVKNTLDADGSLALVQSRKNSSDILRPFASNFLYNAAGAVTAMRLGNGRWENTEFNSRLQPMQIALGSTNAATDLLKLNYTYNTTGNADNNGNVLSQTITVPTVGSNNGFVAVQSYSYDPLNRLKDAVENVTPTGGSSSQSWKQEFSFDRYGNRSFVTGTGHTDTLGSCTTMCNPTFDATNNRITSSGFSYDSSGNTTRDAADRKFTYNAENKQTKAETLSAGTNTVTGTIGEYSYDGDGKRVKKHVPSTGETTIFVYDAAGKQIAEYSTIVANSTDAKVAYLTADHLGSPRINTDVGGAVIARHDYHPFGEEIDGTGGRTTGLNYGSDTVRKQFTGYERDGETDLDFAEARYYNSAHGRFSSVDPITITPARIIDPQQVNLYIYARNNPLLFIDTTGMIIDTNRLSEKDLEKWKKIEELANAKDDKGNYLNPELQEQYSRLQSDKRTFFIENFSFGEKSGTAGNFTITKFNGENDFSEAVIQLDFGKIKSMEKPTAANLVEGFNKFEELFGKDGNVLRLAELFGHEASHGVYALDNTADMVKLQKQMNDRDATLEALPKKNRYPLPPDLVQKMEAIDRNLIPTERYAQQKEQIINGELRAFQKLLQKKKR